MSSTPERRQFTMHQNLLRDVIERQAGTIDKAVLEQVMNLIEAGATRGDITITPKRIVVKDDGVGFQSREEIEAAFEVFGKSDERKLENKRYARFQMGRGQGFAFARTTYRTRTFEMFVDIRDEELGLGYVLKEGLPDVAGCTVTMDLYDELDAYTLTGLTKTIGQHVKYVPVPIYIDKQLVTLDPAKQKWDLETEDAYFKFSESSGSVVVYNLGVFVRHYHEGTIGGIAVSKKQLEVNFARNDVIKSCPVFREIMAKYRTRTERTITERKSFKPEHLLQLMSGLDDGTYKAHDLAGLRLFRTTNGKFIDSYGLRRFDSLAFDRAGSVLADKAMQRSKAIVLDLDYFDEVFGTQEPGVLYDRVSELVERLSQYNKIPPWVETDELYADIDQEQVIIPDSKLSKEERIAISVVRKSFERGLIEWTGDGYERIIHAENRRFLIGEMAGARGWTNGRDFIAIDRETFKKLLRNLDGWAELMLLVAHEFAHTGTERTHNDDFHERYHEYTFLTMRQLTKVFREFTRLRAKAGLGVRDRSSVTAVERVHGSVFADEGGDADSEWDESDTNGSEAAPPAHPEETIEANESAATPSDDVIELPLFKVA